MKLRPLVIIFCMSMAAFGLSNVTLKAENGIKAGWMADGWGSYRFFLKNEGSESAKIVRWTAHWEVKGAKWKDDAWGGDLNETIEPGKTFQKDECGYLPLDLIKAAAPQSPRMVGSFTVTFGGQTKEIAYSIDVPEAKLPEPLKLVKGKTAGMELMASRFKDFKHIDRTLSWVDQSYGQMIDLTGEKPFGGKLMVFKESPEHPWWAYAGQEMILNTKFVGETLKDFDDGYISFGWIHEVGHNFDVLGDWYMWGGPSCEFQANFKLAYAYETIPDQTFRIKWQYAPGYPCPEKKSVLKGNELVEKFFLLFGDGYLADSKRTYDTMTSDEIHAFFQRIQRIYGWEPFRQWYRTYRKLEDKGFKKPEKDEEKISLVCAILSKQTKADLVPVFQRWRFRVTAESVKAVSEKYNLDQM